MRLFVYDVMRIYFSSSIMDLHTFPTAVTKAAVMHVLGEMCARRIPIADPLQIITGRGKHQHSSGRRGVLKEELEKFINVLGLAPQLDENPGRIVIAKKTIEKWLEKQHTDDQTRRERGSGAHGNLFLQVAFAKNRNDVSMNVRAACPFSGATASESQPSS